MEKKCCKNCGSTRVAEGRIDDATFKVKIPLGRLVFSDNVRIQAAACLECGCLNLSVDPDKVNGILGTDK